MMKLNADQERENGLYEKKKSIKNVNKGGVMNVNKQLSLSSEPCGCAGDRELSFFITSLT